MKHVDRHERRAYGWNTTKPQHNAPAVVEIS
jgi:hypothetical protein